MVGLEVENAKLIFPFDGFRNGLCWVFAWGDFEGGDLYFNHLRSDLKWDKNMLFVFDL